MSDRTPCNYCDGWEGDHVVDCPAPLSPIALDFEVKLDAISTAVWAMPKEHKAEFRRAVKAVREAHLAIVARVTQEEREKLLDKMAQMAEGYRDALKIEGVAEYTESRVRQNRDALLLVIDLLRGTP